MILHMLRIPWDRRRSSLSIGLEGEDLEGTTMNSEPRHHEDSSRNAQPSDALVSAPQAARMPRAREESTQVAIETVVEGGPLSGVLDFLCRTMEEESVDRVIACIHPVNEDASVFCDTAAPSLDKSYRERSDGLPVSSLTGPCCYAVITRRTVVADDMATDPKWDKFRGFAEPHGIRSCWSTPILSGDGKVLGTFAHYYFDARGPSHRDERMVELLTRAAAVAIERSRAEAALRELNETLEQRVRAETRERLQIWNVTQDLLAITNLDAICLSINPAWTATLGWAETDLLGTSFKWLLHPDDRERTDAELDHLAKGNSTLRFENRLRAKDGSYHWISWTAAPDGDRVYAMGRDVSESKRAQDALNKAGAELARVSKITSLSALTASIAHEVQQPLSGIITNASTCLRMLDSSPANIEGARDTARRMIRDGHRAADVVTRLRAMFSNREFTLESLDLNEAIGEVIALSASDLQRNRIVFRSELANDLRMVTGDRIQLQQVILNLLRNASDAMVDVHDRPRELLIRTQREDDHRVRLTVRDSGQGLSPDNLDSLFDAFYTTKSGGMGIGLFVSRSIIERHQGRLWAERNAVAPGATFSFSIPCDGKSISSMVSESSAV
jgi:PAS domain S-box-containing protein